jgi:S-adenosylmethionine synthetase
MMAPVISILQSGEPEIEVVERKGIGHPDTICDALAESLSRNLCREYRRRFGQVLHHNVDKALLCGGRAAPAYSGGRVLEPINIYLAGRATSGLDHERIPVRDVAIEGSRAWLRANMHGLDAERHVNIHALVQPGSRDLQDLFSRGAAGDAPLANDTSIGVGYAPLSRLEQLVLEAEQTINGGLRGAERAAWGEDVKVMGVRSESSVQLTVACAMIDRYLGHLDDYLGQKEAIKRFLEELAESHGFPNCAVRVNAADDPASGTVYLTVTGTSAEAGDDGQVGRGNRVNGLITPGRPMSLEAAAGKNPRAHVGKLYNVVAQRICRRLIETMPEISAAQCLLVSRIGAPVTSPAVLELKVATRDRVPLGQVQGRITELAAEQLGSIPDLIDEFIDGAVLLF